MEITILGSGTSTGVPVIGKKTPVNLSTDIKDKRSRSSILIRNHDTSIIIDTGPDFRMQALQHNIQHLDAILFTHHHYDHISGFGDIKPLLFERGSRLNCYCNNHTFEELNSRFNYLNLEQGNADIGVNFILLDSLTKNTAGQTRNNTIQIKSIQIDYFNVIHYPDIPLESTAYLINKKILYITDFKFISDNMKHYFSNLDTIIMGAPLPYPHPYHISIPEAVTLLKELSPQKAFLTHLADQKFHHELEKELPEFIQPAYDNLILNFY